MTPDDHTLMDSLQLDFSKLKSGLRGFNYEVSIKIWKVEGVTGMSPMEMIAKGLGAKVNGSCKGPRSLDKLTKSLGFALRHQGKESWGYQTHDEFTASEPFQHLLDSVITKCRALFDGCQCRPFDLREGHPFYPVFWGFAYLIEKGPDAYLIIASSSD